MLLSTLCYLIISSSFALGKLRVKTNNHKQIKNFCLLKNYLMENFEQELKNIAFPNYEKFSDVNSTYTNLVNKITQVINNHENNSK